MPRFCGYAPLPVASSKAPLATATHPRAIGDRPSAGCHGYGVLDVAVPMREDVEILVNGLQRSSTAMSRTP